VTMTRKPFAAFGRVLYANYYDAGNVVDVATSGSSKTVLFVSDGSTTVRDKQTGQIAWESGPGWFSAGGYQDRVYTCTANTATVCWCYDPLVNQGYVPVIEVLHVPNGQSASLPVGTNLFLCSGTATVNGKHFTGPYQLAVRSPNSTLVANGTVYGLIFK
jgi:hypothetical protein